MTTALIDHIVLDDKGVARVSGTRMKVIHLVMDKMANNSTPEEMTVVFPPADANAQIHAALSYYYDHKSELDARIAESVDRFEELRAQSKSQPTLRRNHGPLPQEV